LREEGFLVLEAWAAADAAWRDSRKIRIARFISSRVGGSECPGDMRNLSWEIKVWFSGVIFGLQGLEELDNAVADEPAVSPDRDSLLGL
jgi:hypothetical protein